MSDLKTKVTEESVEDYISALKDEQQRKDCEVLLKLMKKLTKKEPKLWSHGTIGFGEYEYKGKSGRTGTWYPTGFAPRKGNISINFISGLDNHKALLKKLGKHKTGTGCLYINSLQDIDNKVLGELVKANMKIMAQKIVK